MSGVQRYPNCAKTGLVMEITADDKHYFDADQIEAYLAAQTKEPQVEETDVFTASDFECLQVYRAPKDIALHANRLLRERGTAVYGTEYNVVRCENGKTIPAPINERVSNWSRHKEAGSNEPNYVPPTHQALIIGVRPIEKPDTAEGLLREFVEYNRAAGGDWHTLVARASKFLEKK